MKLTGYIDRILVSLGIKESAREKYTKSYHFQRALELRDQKRDGDAFEELRLESRENPNNGYADLLIGQICLDHNDLGTALQATNNALNILLKTGDKEYISHAYYIRSRVQRALGEGVQWHSDAQYALEYDKDNVDALGALGDYYYFFGKYDESDIRFSQIVGIQPHNPYGYMGLGRNDQARNKHDSAIGHFGRAVQLDADYAAAYSFRANSLIDLGRKAEAMDDLIRAIELDEEKERIRGIALRLSQPELNVFKLKLKAKALKNQNSIWYNALGLVSFWTGDLLGAYAVYRMAYDMDGDPVLQDIMASILSELGLDQLAVDEESLAISKSPDNLTFGEHLARFYFAMGKLDSAIEEISKLQEKDPDNYIYYYYRGRYLFEKKAYNEAIDNFATSISLHDSFAMSYLYRGWALSELARDDEANLDFEYIVEKHETLESGDVASGWALFLHDLDDKAVTFVDSILANSCYNDWRNINDKLMYAAAVYSRTNNTDKALDCMRRYINNNGTSPWHLKNSILLSTMNNIPEYKEILDELDSKVNDNLIKIRELSAKSNADSLKGLKAEIPFTRDGKMCKVKCTVNGLDLHFIFDTGASEVSISSVEATFMLKNGYLNESDLSGKQYYQTADGSVAEGVRVNLKNVVFGGVSLSDVKAGVVTNQRAPLLLGQSILERLGRIEIDNEKNVIVING